MQMNIFGGFSLSDGQVSVNESTLHSNKLNRLLIYILLHRDRDLSHQELIDTFWQEEHSRNPEGALKNLVYRLRSELRVFCTQELILTLPGAYRWNPEVRLQTDYEEMDALTEAVKKEDMPERKRYLAEKAIALYKKEAPFRASQESWLLSRLTYYRLQYLETVKVLCGIYEKEQEWDAIERVTTQALDVDGLDEDLHYWRIKSQIGAQNYEQALQYYDYGKKLFYDHLGIRDVERFHEIYNDILSLSTNQMSDISSLVDSVTEKEEPREVFVCEYPVFREIYRVEARRIRRTGIAEYMLLITMKSSSTSKSDAQSLEERIRIGMQILEDLLKRTLRAGDVVAQYSNTQYDVLLPACNYESTGLVADRIERLFRTEAGKRRLVLQFEVEEVFTATEK